MNPSQELISSLWIHIRGCRPLSSGFFNGRAAGAASGHAQLPETPGRALPQAIGEPPGK